MGKGTEKAGSQSCFLVACLTSMVVSRSHWPFPRTPKDLLFLPSLFLSVPPTPPPRACLVMAQLLEDTSFCEEFIQQCPAAVEVLNLVAQECSPGKSRVFSSQMFRLDYCDPNKPWVVWVFFAPLRITNSFLLP